MGRPAAVKTRQSTSSAASLSDTSMIDANSTSRDEKAAPKNDDVSMVRALNSCEARRSMPLQDATCEILSASELTMGPTGRAGDARLHCKSSMTGCWNRYQNWRTFAILLRLFLTVLSRTQIPIPTQPQAVSLAMLLRRTVENAEQKLLSCEKVYLVKSTIGSTNLR